MPFFWGTLMREHGSIAGNARLGSSVTLTNTHRFSYPGYSEILLGEAHDDEIKSNDPMRNPYVDGARGAADASEATPAAGRRLRLLERLRRHRRAHRRGADGQRRVRAVRVAGPGGAASSAGCRWRRHALELGAARRLHVPVRDGSSRRARPRVVYLALGETDDWAHDGRYDRVLETYARSDALSARAVDVAAGGPRVSRPHAPPHHDGSRTGPHPKDWRNHGAKVEGAQEVWIALASPRWRRAANGGSTAAHTNQVAATLAGWMGDRLARLTAGGRLPDSPRTDGAAARGAPPGGG